MKYKLIVLLISLSTLLPRADALEDGTETDSKNEGKAKIVDEEKAEIVEEVDDESDAEEGSETEYEKITDSTKEDELKRNLCELIAKDKLSFLKPSIDRDKLIKIFGCKTPDLPLEQQKTTPKTSYLTPKTYYVPPVFPSYERSSYGPSSRREQKRTMFGGIDFTLDKVSYDDDGPFARYMKEQSAAKKKEQSAAKKSQGKANPLAASRQLRGPVSTAQKSKGSDPILQKKNLSIPPQLSTTLNELE